jgi:hypothetical protein
MKLLDNIRRSLARRRHERHIRALRKMRVVLSRPPDERCRRNTTEASGRVS